MGNLISCCRDPNSKNEFWRLQLKANCLKTLSNIIAIAELSSPTREICRSPTNYLMMRQLEGLEVLQGEALETQISQAQQFCQINVCFVKNQSTSQTQRPERSYTVYRNFAPMKR